MASLIRVAVVGAAGRMGREVVEAVAGDNSMTLVAAVDKSSVGSRLNELVPNLEGGDGLCVQADLAAALERTPADVVVDFSNHSVVRENATVAIDHACSPVIGATGLTTETLTAIREASARTGVPALFAPNFAVGAVLMMKFSELAARWYGDVEIIELHHDRKEDAPSGTALLTAELIAAAKTQAPSSKPTPLVKAPGALGGRWHDVPVHSVRLPGLLAHQLVMFGGPGETLSIRHDSTDRAGFMQGVLLAIREVRSLKGLVIGLDKLLFRELA
ncbi:MAG: 4-hydroxy-tetrahydrodipicolinate reductase [Fimbriimonadaceae bacterium]